MARSSSNDVFVPRRRRIDTEDPDRVTPNLGGGNSEAEVCYFCFCSPCVVNEDVIPDFVRGSAAPDPLNVTKRFRLYRKFRSYLRRLGLWDFDPDKARKRRAGHENSPRDIIPWCVKSMVRERFPNPP